MKELKSNLFFFSLIALAVFTSLTLLQVYYSVYIHLVLFFMCILFANNRHKFVVPLAVGGVVCILFFFLSFDRVAVTPIGQIGFYLHYITWPVVLIAALQTLNLNQKLIIMRLMLIVGIVGSLLSLRVLLVDQTISRILAGEATEAEMQEYYSRGVGGYGTVYSTTFLCFGAIYWLTHTKVKLDKILIIIYLATAYLFIIYASYTTAILITIAVSLVAMTSKIKPMMKSLVVVAAIIILIFLLWDPIIDLIISIFNRLELTVVVRRLTQLTEATENNDLSSLARAQLYLKSWESFIAHPLVGSDVAGRHSQILDTMAYFGIAGVLMPILLVYYSLKCISVSSRRLAMFYGIFFVLITVNTCSAMQIPVSVFFLCPLIINAVKEQNKKDKSNKKLSA